VSGEREDRPARATRPPRRKARRSVGLGLVVAFVVGAFLIGAGTGYVVRGAPSEGDSVTVEREVPVVTVTVETP
jgi:hypothetical protein